MVTDYDKWDGLPTRVRPWLNEQPLRGDGDDLGGATATYAELKVRIKQAGLLKEQPVYYAYKILMTLGLLAVGVLPLVRRPPIELVMLDAVFLAFIFTQLGFLFHDVCHRALARGAWQNAVVGLVFGNLLTGISRAWWTDNHNAHHSHPNDIDLDPNADIPILAFTEAQARTRHGPARFIVARQHIFLFPIFCLQGFNMLIQSVVFLVRHREERLRLEIPLLVVHYVLYGGLILILLGPIEGPLFVLVHQALIGLYAGSVFAPNHKGMPVLDRHTRVGFLQRQVLTSRNVYAHPLTDFWFGGLNYQIEHHLFPTLPRNRLGAAQVIVKAFCAAHNIAYHETGIIASYKEILRHFRDVGAVLRA
jgi:fatty acid desaturase